MTEGAPQGEEMIQRLNQEIKFLKSQLNLLHDSYADHMRIHSDTDRENWKLSILCMGFGAFLIISLFGNFIQFFWR